MGEGGMVRDGKYLIIYFKKGKVILRLKLKLLRDLKEKRK